MACRNDSLGLFGEALYCELLTRKVTIDQFLKDGRLRALLIAIVLAVNYPLYELVSADLLRALKIFKSAR